MSADRNLLFGVLALQMDFIRREQLVAAMHAWVLRKSDPLGAILVEQNALDPSCRDLLDALVEKHLQQHHNDPQQSLAALSSLGSAREALSGVGDADINASLAHVSAEWRPDDSHQPTLTGAPTSAGGRFRILRPHAKGGLGEVFVARDEELNREVALKEIQLQYAHHPEQQSRFLLEAEITGGLEHPGIVPVYGLGHYHDGRPFYAMRFIRGDSLAEAIARYHAPDATRQNATDRNLEFRALLRRLIDVCQAVAYAHSRGVLHRDLKPGNVMLGKYGETLVVDWGLAKAVGHGEERTPREGETTLKPASGSGSAPTAIGAFVGTPAYASPEQSAGRWDELGPRSDVYSLGATLYAVLTGKPPIEGESVGEVLKKVQAGEVTPPRRHNSQTPRALEAVCLKALALQPEARYLSPRELAADLDHWLADEPVAAYREPLPARARRWLRKHQTAAASVAASLVVAAVGLAIGLTVVAGLNNRLETSNHKLTQANTDLQAANARERAARKLAQTRETEAQASAATAREQSQLALETLNSVVFEIQEKLKTVAGAEEVRRSLLKTVLEKLERVSDKYQARAAIDRSTWAALIEIAEVILRIGVGDAPEEPESDHAGAPPSPENRDALAAARRLYEQAHEIARTLTQAATADAQAQRGLSVSLNKLGDVRRQAGDPEEAAQAYEESLTIARTLAQAAPADAQAQRDLMISYYKLGFTERAKVENEKAETFFQQGLNVLDAFRE